MTTIFRSTAALAFALLLGACSSMTTVPPNQAPPPQAPRGTLLSQRSVAMLGTAEIDAQTAEKNIQALTGSAKCAVDVRQLVYATVGPGGVPGYTASGALFLPVESATCPGPFPLVAYTHGTQVLKSFTMADTARESFQMIAFYAAQGYIVAATDYLGFGESTFSYHPYTHAATEASAAIDALLAARRALAAEGTPLSGKLFITGYSQGGHAAMATHRALEADPWHGLTVTAAGPMSGAYDLYRSYKVDPAAAPAEGDLSSLFVTYTVTSYQKVYGTLYANPADYFKEPYVNGIESLLPGTMTIPQYFTTGRLPTRIGDLITQRVYDDLNTPDSALGRALADNTLLGWTPRAPVLLCGGARDRIVPFWNAATAAADMASRGGTVTTVDVDQIPEFAPWLPPATATPAQLAAYHGTIAPLCNKIVRDRLFAPLL